MAGKSLLSLKTHWISADFVKVSAVLHVVALEGSHTGIHIGEKFTEMLPNWNINTKNTCTFILFYMIMHQIWRRL